MQTITPTAPRAPIPDAAPHPAGGHASADPAGFASLLRQTRMPAAPPTPLANLDSAAPAEPPDADPPAASAPADADTGNAEATTAAPTAGRPRTPSKTRAATTDTPAAKADGEPDTPARDAAANDGSAAATPPALDPTVMHWLAGLQRAATPARSGADTRPAHGARDDDTAPSSATPAAADTLDTETATRGRSTTDANARDAITDRREALVGQRDAAAATGSAGRFADALLAAAPGEKAAASAAPAPDAPTAPPPSAMPAPATASTAAPAEPVAVALATPIDAPDFAQQLGLRLGVLARDGVQRAELQLNPAEMGPVAIQIVMDGTQARIDFGADVAATRHAIEAGLPELASALRDAGFTLAGGGVSSNGGGQGRGDGSDADARGGPARARAVTSDTLQHVGSAAARIVRAGGVDLFA
ncbi:MAG TPA: flagellar hook-length control protein FliK [Burkholderiaceae bacterium]|nr:flagellar hook-length control protein FliK [Burkholderiaceae bacterium]